jgi:hypothetical protein
MNDYTIKNLSSLEAALTKLSTNENSQSATSTSSAIKSEETPQDKQKRPTTRSSRNNTELTVNNLLQNLIAQQCETNTRLGSLVDSIYSLHNYHERQIKAIESQNEILLSIARNTVGQKSTSGSSSPANVARIGVNKDDSSIRDYGFSSSDQVITEYIRQLLDLVKVQGKSRINGHYRVSRDLNFDDIRRLVGICVSNPFIIKGERKEALKFKGNKIPSFVKAAERMGRLNDTSRKLTIDLCREIATGAEYGQFSSVIEDIITRMSILHEFLPSYEADIIKNVQHPYFTKDGDVIINWPVLKPRDDSQYQAIIASLPIKKTEKLAKFIAVGISITVAMKSIDTKQ